MNLVYMRILHANATPADRQALDLPMAFHGLFLDATSHKRMGLDTNLILHSESFEVGTFRKHPPSQLTFTLLRFTEPHPTPRNKMGYLPAHLRHVSSP